MHVAISPTLTLGMTRKGREWCGVMEIFSSLNRFISAILGVRTYSSESSTNPSLFLPQKSNICEPQTIKIPEMSNRASRIRPCLLGKRLEPFQR